MFYDDITVECSILECLWRDLTKILGEGLLGLALAVPGSLSNSPTFRFFQRGHQQTTIGIQQTNRNMSNQQQP